MTYLKTALFIASLVPAWTATVSAHPVIELWPDHVPGETKPKAEAVISENARGNVTRVEAVTNPLLEVYDPGPGKRNGTGLIICPGGGYHILAIDKEGYEVAEWFQKRGYTAFVLQYRVPQKRAGALMDAQRALRYVRHHADDWELQRDQIGILGFSAGGSLAARTSTRYEKITYPPVDKRDTTSSRPDFTVLIYPAYLDQGENRSLTPELEVTPRTPPMFLYVAGNDKHANSSLVMTQALLDAKVRVEMHLLPTGGHGFGLRAGNPAAEQWPGLAEAWIRRTLNASP